MAPAGNGLLWKVLGPLIGAVSVATAGLLWNSFRTVVTEGKADSVAVEQLKADNETAHKDIKADIDDVKQEQKSASKTLKRIAKKLKIEE